MYFVGGSPFSHFLCLAVFYRKCHCMWREVQIVVSIKMRYVFLQNLGTCAVFCSIILMVSLVPKECLLEGAMKETLPLTFHCSWSILFSCVSVSWYGLPSVVELILSFACCWQLSFFSWQTQERECSKDYLSDAGTRLHFWSHDSKLRVHAVDTCWTCFNKLLFVWWVCSVTGYIDTWFSFPLVACFCSFSGSVLSVVM